MTGASKLTVFAEHAFVQGMKEPQRALLTSGVDPFAVGAGDYLAREGEPADAFYLIRSGQVAIGLSLGARGAVPIQTVGSNEIVGWSWVVSPYRWQFDARALDNVEGWKLDAGWLREQCEKNHDLGFQLLKQLVAVISGRLAATRVQRLDIYK